MRDKCLSVEDVSLRFGGILALEGVSLSVYRGEIYSIIGPNGAGKTSLFNCICGVYRPSKGKITFNGYELTNLKPHRIAELGVARTFQNIELFRELSVIDNLLLGRHIHMKSGPFACAFFFGRSLNEEAKNRRKVEEIIEFLEIEDVRKKAVGTLAYGIQKRVELGRALALEPELLLLDEPMAGMNVEETEDMARFILDIKEELGITTIMVEHDMDVVMDIADRIAVLNFGSKIGEGDATEIQKNNEVVKAFLGEDSS